MPNPESIFSALIWRDYTTSIHQSCNQRLFLSLCAITQTNVLHVVHTSFSTHFLMACCEWKTRAPLSIPNLIGWGGKTLLIPHIEWPGGKKHSSKAVPTHPSPSSHPKQTLTAKRLDSCFSGAKKIENLRMCQHVKRSYKA